MKLTIKKSGKLGITIWLPNSLFKSKFAIKSLLKDEKMSGTSPEAVKKFLNDSYKFIKKYKRRHGHITLLDVFVHDGYYIKIRL